MGMFDTVTDVEIACPECGASLGEFQSKDGPCVCNEISFRDVTNFYISCRYCDSWIEFNLKPSIRAKWVFPDDYDISANGEPVAKRWTS